MIGNAEWRGGRMIHIVLQREHVFTLPRTCDRNLSNGTFPFSRFLRALGPLLGSSRFFFDAPNVSMCGGARIEGSDAGRKLGAFQRARDERGGRQILLWVSNHGVSI